MSVSPVLGDVLSGASLTDFPMPSSGGVLVLERQQPVFSAMRAMMKVGCSSAPVRSAADVAHAVSSPKAHVPRDDHIDTLVSLSDFVAFALHTVEADAHQEMCAKTNFFQFVKEHARTFSIATVEDVCTYVEQQQQNLLRVPPGEGIEPIAWKRTQFCSRTATARDALTWLGVYGVHRLIVVDEADKTLLVNIVTQSQMLQWLYNRGSLNNMPVRAMLGQSIESLGLLVPRRGQLVAAVPQDSVLSAFLTMTVQHVGGMPVIRPDTGAMVGALSAADVQLLLDFPEDLLAAEIFEPHESRLHFRHVFEDVQTFLKAKAGREAQKNPLQQHHEALYAPPTITLGEIIESLVKNQLHRVYIVSPAMQPLSVVSLSDVLAIIARAL